MEIHVNTGFIIVHEKSCVDFVLNAYIAVIYGFLPAFCMK